MNNKNYLIENHTDVFSMISRYRSQIMGFAAIWIIIFHTWIHTFSTIPGLSFAEKFIVRVGFCGVDIFFFLSGIGMIFAIEKSSVPMFYYRRIKRLVLPFVLVGLLKIFFNGWSVTKFLKAITGYSFYFENMYTLLWFVPAVIAFYLLFPVYYKLLKNVKNPVVFTFIVLEIWLLFSIKANGIMRRDLFGFTNRIPVFLLGVLFAYVSKNKKIIWDRSVAALSVVTLALGSYLAYLTNFADMFLIVESSNSFLPNLLITLSICPLLAFIFSKISWLCKFFGFFGAFTLEFYCIQEWLNGQIMDTLCSYIPNIAANLVFIGITTLIAYIIYKANIIIWKQVDKIVLKNNIN
ncbi:MAG: acyltransferase [Ruminococcaceae bacterium]|nr:acyltransferase [Oscillospiraceae bacterium]